ncbi:hypothetical protein QEZ52_04990 [Aliisedimentitalea scapharcae]|uniref:Lipoprotein n=1 Tax=Aliisedimentitalea scapharcae TaxID=1524259 RepID=A0ABZ2XXY4_9RHOB
MFLILGAVCLALGACTRPQQPNADDATIAAVSYRDPGPATLTLYTMVNNRSGQGAHASLMINASERVIFDPAGSFKADIIPERNDVLFGITPAAEKAYRGSHARETHHVVVQTLEVTPEQAQIAYNLALRAGPVAGAYCANSTATILKQVPGLESINVTFYPVKLADQFGTLPGAVTKKYYENDSADLQEGLAQNNAILNAQAAAVTE